MLAKITTLVDPTTYSGGTYLFIGLLALAAAFCAIGPRGERQDRAT